MLRAHLFQLQHWQYLLKEIQSCTYTFCHVSGYNRDGNRQSLTGFAWNCTGAKDGEARNVQRRGLSHQQPVHSFHQSGIVTNEPKLPFWEEGGSLVPHDLSDSLTHSSLRFLHLSICSAATDLCFLMGTGRVITLSPITSSFPCPASTAARRPARRNSSSHWHGGFWTCRVCVKNPMLSCIQTLNHKVKGQPLKQTQAGRRQSRGGRLISPKCRSPAHSRLHGETHKL